ncbi:hypothetical protein OSB04_un000446 [Centaurea solstitialis]|uniref:CCHC-type domain-containing protein n=1 Tax=Centaurea solstitialis TaxID=347529 RepID=A0AA38SI26_9ASTR|nr:hypothetical protein OSB04_un000446 [Centaurea solstitialis]
MKMINEDDHTEPVVNIAEPEINEDDLTIAELLVKMPEVVKPTKGVVFKEPEVVKQIDLPVDSKRKGKEKVIEEEESDSDTEIDEAKRKIMEYEASEDLARKLSLEKQERVNKEVEERKRKADKKKPVKKTQKKSISKAETEKRRIMVRYLSAALGKPFQFFSRWTLEEIENKYNVTREAMHLEALEEQQVETEDVALVQRKRKRDQIEEQVTTEGNPEDGVEKTKETVADSEQQVVQVIEKKEEVAEKTVEKEVEVPKQIEAQPSKAMRKKSVAKRSKMSKEVEEPSNISMRIYFENNQMDYFKVFRSDGTNEVFANHLGIFRKLSKSDLKKMYEIACTKEVEDFEEARMLVEDLKMMFAFSKTKAELKEKGKRDQDDSIGEGKVISWNTYENRVFSVNFEKGRMSFFLMDKRYDFEPIMMGSMLEVKKKAENLSEFDKELVGRLREQLLELNAHYFDEEVIELKQKKVTGWGVDQNLRYVVQFDDGSELCDVEWENILEECTRENLKEMYEQRCTVIKVAVNDRDDPDQAKKREFALECLFWLFEPFRLLGVKNSTCEDVKEWRWFDKCKVYSLNINDREMEYYFEECETDALDIQRLQCMMKGEIVESDTLPLPQLKVNTADDYHCWLYSVTTAAEDWRLPLPVGIKGVGIRRSKRMPPRRSQRVRRRQNNSSGALNSDTTETEVDPAITAAVNQALTNLLPNIIAQAVEAAQQHNNGDGNLNGTGGTSGTTPGGAIHVWLERFQKQKPQSFSSAPTPVDAENWISHIQKIFEVLGCPEEHKTKLAAYKLEGDAQRWWYAIKQAKGNAYVDSLSWMGFREAFYQQYFSAAEKNSFVREFAMIRQKDDETVSEYLARFLRLAGFAGSLAGSASEQAEKYRSKLINEKFSDVAEAADAAKNIEMERQDFLMFNSDGSRKRNREAGQQSQQHGSSRGNQRGQSSNRRQGQWHGQNQGQKHQTRSGNQGNRGSLPPCKSCGKHHSGICYRASRACFLCGEVGHMAKDCKNPRDTSKGNDSKPTQLVR